ncbi:MAG TPA: LamG domain-containing protein [Candidatus Paceibacterota bacterium]|nr:LamG domain-containing protein [Candidatus Paceibacterota bacterium]
MNNTEINHFVKTMKMKVVAGCLAGLHALVAHAGTNLVITSISANGELSWSNLQGAIQYRVEWAPTPNGVWTNSWNSLNAISATGATYSVQVPMFYRLVAIMPDYTRLLLHSDGANGATSFPDAAGGRLVAVMGDAQVSTVQSRFGGGAAYFDGSGDYLETATSPDFEPGDQAFTLDFWLYPLDNGDSSYLIGKSTPDAGQGYDVRYRNNTIVLVGVNGWAENIVSDASVSANSWHHVAVSSTTNTVYLFIDGSQKGTCPRANVPGQDIPLRIGRTAAYGGAAFHGYMDEIRFSLGLARWTNSFVAPTAPNIDD